MSEGVENKEVHWPTKKLDKALGSSCCDITTKRIDIWLAPDVKDVTHVEEVRKQLRYYAPDITQLGPGLYRERYGPWDIWGGLLVRGLEAESETQADKTRKRCLQYIYIWTKQQSAVSLFWMVIVPILMGSWGFFIRDLYASLIITLQQSITLDLWGTLFTPSELLLPVLATGFVSLPLLLSGFWDHRWDMHLGSGFTFRSTTLLIPFSIMMWFVAFSWIVPAMILGFSVFVCGLYWLLDQIGFVSTSHSMDYLPVFIWLKSSDANGWEFDRSSWDRHHYNIECMDRADLTKKSRYPFMTPNLAIRKTKDGKTEERVRLQMDNPWHAVRPGGSVPRIILLSSIIGLVILIPIAILMVNSGRYTEFPTGGLSFVILCTLTVLAFRTLMRSPSKLMSGEELKNLDPPSEPDEINDPLEKTKNHLNKERLEILWNLVKIADTGPWLFRKLRSLFRRGKKFPPDISPRFVIITKLQDPFNYYGLARYYKTFRDDLDYLYLYISSRCRMTNDDRIRSAESKLTFEREGRQIEAQGMLRFEAYQMATREQFESAALTRMLLDEIDVEKGTITKDQVEEFIRKRK